MDSILPPLRQEEEKYKKSNYEYEIRLEGFNKEFKELISFTQPLSSIKQQLARERVELADKEKY